MPGGRRIPVTVDADTKGDFDKAARGLDDVDKSATKADKSLRTMSKGAQALDGEINKTLVSVKSLRAEFERTGDLGLLKDVRRLDNTRKSLERLKNDFVRAGDDSGKGFVASLSSAVDGGLQSVGKLVASHPYIAAGVAAGITLGLPLIGAALTAAVGGGVIAGGILLAAKDPRVGHAWSALGESAMDKLSRSADVFVVPLVHGAEVFGHTLDRIMPSIEADFARLAPVADKLFAGAAGAVENLMPGIDALSRAAGPILTDLANELPRLAASLSQMFTDIAAGGPGAAAALRDFLTVTELTVVNIGMLIGALEKYYVVDRAFKSILAAALTNNQPAWDNAVMSVAELRYGTEAVTPVADKAVDAYKRFAGAVGATGQGAQLTAEQLKALSGQIDATALTTDTLAGKMTDKLLNSMMGLDQAVLGFAESQTRLSESTKNNGLQLDIHTAKGQANREAILGAVQANIAQFDALMRAGAGAGEASAAYDANTAALERQLQKAGYTQTEIDGLIGKYRSVPDQVNTDIAMHGLTEAIQSLDDAIRLANHLDGRKVTTTFVEIYKRINVNAEPSGGYGGPAHSGIGYSPGLATGGFRTADGLRRAAVGLLIPPSDPGTVLTGEPQTGGEALIPFRGISPGRAAMLGQTVLGGYGYDVVPRSSGHAAPVMVRGGGARGGGARGGVLEFRAAPGDQVAELLLSLLRPTVRGRYGGDPEAALGGAN